VNLQQSFELALQHLEAGRFGEAETLWRQILAVDPRDVDALHLLGVTAAQTGRHDLAIDLIRQAIALRPHFPEAYNNLGIVLKERGYTEEAVAAYRRAIALRPGDPEAHCGLGIVLRETGELDQALAAYRQAIALRPDYPQAHCGLGIVLADKGELDQAIASCRQAIALRPNYAEAHGSLAMLLSDKGELDQAIAAYRQAIVLNPTLPEVHNNLGMALKDKGSVDEAVLSYRQAIALNPELPEVHNNLGIALRDRGELDEAVSAFRRAIALKPGFALSHNNLGTVLRAKGQLEEAVAAYRQALALDPDLPEAHHNLALALLLRGDFLEGWEEQEWRWKRKDFRTPGRDFSHPQWDGSMLEGRTLLLHCEQGLGDTLQFFRYLPLVTRRGGKVILECQPELQRLLQANAAELQVVSRGDPIPTFDVHCPLLTLPRLFATDLSNIPRNVPYIRASAADTEAWRERLAGNRAELKVGLVWAGSAANANDRNRSIKLATLGPLTQVSGVRFISLQKGQAAAECETPPQGLQLIDVANHLKDFTDTAAIIDTLDLIISVDTAVVHLAGAMGKPVWTLVPFDPDWRWLLNRSDSPWYPTMRLFRQPRIGDWSSVVAEVRDQVQLLVQSRGEQQGGGRSLL
jgi:Flp pilus assembly protein TadD